jgi:mannose-6-phosphate isomerase
MNQAIAPESALPGSQFVRYSVGEADTRPWGCWEVLATGPNYVLKRVQVQPGQRLSLQYHEFRSEHWTILGGAAEVEIAGEVRRIEAGEHVFIPVRAPHRIRNVGDLPLTFVEVQTGEVLDEADIVRLVDDYGRA